ncbi:diacylglycerol/lipid kinase family protein [Streptomyces sp. NPDC051567]|uniref:diacylglycerol/lipid kinase family protein n=1 Tax=Streptomyces sp. NPDC051567 TaxID=3365660 RepID=UPI0037ACEB69
MSPSPSPHAAPARARLLARVALAFALCAVLTLLAVAGLRSAVVVVVGLAGLALAAAGFWWFLSRRGVLRLVGLLIAVAAPVAVLVYYLDTGLWTVALAALVLWAGALGCAWEALRWDLPQGGMAAAPAPPPRRPVLIMNPRSGGGKVGEFGLVARAEALGARVILLDTATPQDVTALARQAVADGADLLGVAGGDGTQALVAEVASRHDLPFLVVSAGTRNHLAMDLGLDRTDPSTCLEALTDGEELRIDLGTVAGRAFVNTVSFGAYAQIVQSPEYRDAKAGTALDALPDLLSPREDGTRISALADETLLEEPQVLLVSNNPYTTGDPIGTGRRPRLDTGTLGVLGLRVTDAAQAAEVAVRGGQAAAATVLEARTVVVSADAPTIPVAVDGEALVLPTPVHCAVRPGALRVRVPRDRPGTPRLAPRLDWKRVGELALRRAAPTATGR